VILKPPPRAVDIEIVLTATIVFAALLVLWGGLLPLRRQ
jgi:hypothetical protein